MPGAVVIPWLKGIFVGWKFGAFAGFAANLVYYVGSMYVLGAISKALAPKIAGPDDGAKRILKSYKGTSTPRRVIYGTVRCGGHIAFEGLSGFSNEYYWRVIVLGTTNGAPYEAISHMYIDDQEINLSTQLDGDNIVNTGKYNGYIKVNTHLGSDTQAADSDLVAAITPWTTSHQGKGLCYVVLRLERNDDIFSHWPEFTFKVQGAKLYDPRLDDSAGGSGSPSQSSSDPSTWTWSDNPALILRDYITCSRYGMGEANSRIDDTVVSASANECEEQVAIPPAASPSNYQDRYTGSGIIEGGQKHADNIAAIRSAMMGVLTYTRGKYEILAGSYTAPTVTLTDDDLAGGIAVDTLRGDDLYNSVRGKYLSADRKYQYTSFVPRSSATYVTEDNSETKWRDIDLPLVTSEYQAQRQALVLVEQSRNKLQVSADFKLSAYRLKIFETVALTISEFGWSAKPFRVLNWRFNPQGTVSLTLQEETISAWADPAVGDYLTPSSESSTAFGDSTPDKPLSITADGVYGGIVVSWVPASNASADSYEVAEHTANTPVSSGTIVWSGSASNALIPKATSVTRYYWVRAVRGTHKSGWRGSGETTTGVGATSLAPASEGLTGSLDKSTVSGSGATPVTTDQVTCTAAGGSGTGYTYTWTYVSGDDSPQTITPNSPSSAATTFNGTTNNKTAVWKCVVDDSLGGGPVDSDHVTVSIGGTPLASSLSTTLLEHFYTSTPDNTTGSAVCTASGGTPTYTYQWSRQSGSTSITANSATSATTTFNIASGASGDQTAVFYCTVTDSASPQATAQSSNTVTVKFYDLS